MPEPFERVLIHEYFYKLLCEIEDREAELLRSMRTKRGLIILCDQLRSLEIERVVVMRMYEELKQLF